MYQACGEEDSWVGLSRDATGAFGWTDRTSFGRDIIGVVNGAQVTDLFGVTAAHYIHTGTAGLCARWAWSGSGMWDDEPCTESFPYTCKICTQTFDPPPPPPPPAPPSPPPPSPVTCTYQFHSQYLTFQAAEAQCVAAGGNLASLHSEEDASVVYDAAGQVNSWIGLSHGRQL